MVVVLRSANRANRDEVECGFVQIAFELIDGAAAATRKWNTSAAAAAASRFPSICPTDPLRSAAQLLLRYFTPLALMYGEL